MVIVAVVLATLAGIGAVTGIWVLLEAYKSERR